MPKEKSRVPLPNSTAARRRKKRLVSKGAKYNPEGISTYRSHPRSDKWSLEESLKRSGASERVKKRARKKLEKGQKRIGWTDS